MPYNNRTYVLIPSYLLGSTHGRHTLLILDPIRTYLGGIPLDPKASSKRRQRRDQRIPTDLQKNFTGCIDDIRFHGYQLHFNGTQDFAIAFATGKNAFQTKMGFSIL
jgi:hypothetical protein